MSFGMIIAHCDDDATLLLNSNSTDSHESLETLRLLDDAFSLKYSKKFLPDSFAKDLADILCKQLLNRGHGQVSDSISNVLINRMFLCSTDVHFEVIIRLLSCICCTLKCQKSSKFILNNLLKHSQLNVYFQHDIYLNKLAMIVDFFQTTIIYLDYKSRRDLLKTLLKIIPKNELDIKINALLCLKQIKRLVHICLLDEGSIPYLMVHEIALYAYTNSDGLSYPWYISDQIYQYTDRFRTLAGISSIKGKCWLFPVNFHTLPHLYTWKLHPSKLRSMNTFSIPVIRSHLMNKQRQLLLYAIYQDCNLEFNLRLFGLSARSKTYVSSVEDELITIMIAAISYSDNVLKSEEEELYYWSSLLTTVTRFCLNYVVTIEGLIGKLHRQLSKVSSENGRFWFAWLLYNLVMLHISHGGKCHGISAMLEILDEIFPEVNAIPDTVASIDSFRNIVRCTAALCWRAMSKKLMARNTILDWPAVLRCYHGLIADLITEAKDGASDLSGSKLVLFLMIIEPFQSPLHIERFVVKHWSDPAQYSLYPNILYRTNGPTIPMDLNAFALIGPAARLAITRAYVRQVIRPSMTSSIDKPFLLSPGGVENFARVVSFPESEQISLNESATILRLCWHEDYLVICCLYCELLCFRLNRVHEVDLTRFSIYPELLTIAFRTNGTKTSFAHLQLMNTAHFAALNVLSSINNFEVILTLLKATDNQLDAFICPCSDELNKTLALKIIRSLTVSGLDKYSDVAIRCINFVKRILKKTPHSWPNYILNFMPPFCHELYSEYTVQEVNMEIQEEINEEFTRLVKISTGINVLTVEMSRYLNCAIQPDLFLAFMYKYILGGMPIKNCVPVCDKLMKSFCPTDTPRMLTKFVDYLSCELISSSTLNAQNAYFKNSVDALLHMCFTLHIVSYDKLVYTLLTRPSIDQAIQITLVFVLCVLMKCTHLDEARRILPTVSANFERNSNWHNTHTSLHKAMPEKQMWEGLKEICGTKSTEIPLPIFYLNFAFRMIPVIDIFIHRLIEMPLISKQLDKLSKFAFLYKFHNAPIQYVYSTLFYYFKLLSTQKLDTWRIVKAILSVVFKEFNEEEWCYEPTFLDEVNQPNCSENGPINKLNIHIIVEFIIRSIMESIHPVQSKIPIIFPNSNNDSSSEDHMSNPADATGLPRISPYCKSREYQNRQIQSIHAGCIQVMTVSPSTDQVWRAIDKIIISSGPSRNGLYQKMNAIGLLYSALPVEYWNPIFKNVLDIVTLSEELNFASVDMIAELLNLGGFVLATPSNPINQFMVALHAMFEHAPETIIIKFVEFCTDFLISICTNEQRFLFICQALIPFLPKVQACGTQGLLKAVNCISEALLQADRNVDEFIYETTIAQLFCLIKYKLTGDKANFTILENLRCLSLRQSLSLLIEKK